MRISRRERCTVQNVRPEYANRPPQLNRVGQKATVRIRPKNRGDGDVHAASAITTNTRSQCDSRLDIVFDDDGLPVALHLDSDGLPVDIDLDEDFGASDSDDFRAVESPAPTSRRTHPLLGSRDGSSSPTKRAVTATDLCKVATPLREQRTGVSNIIPANVAALDTRMESEIELRLATGWKKRYLHLQGTMLKVRDIRPPHLLLTVNFSVLSSWG